MTNVIGEGLFRTRIEPRNVIKKKYKYIEI